VGCTICAAPNQSEFSTLQGHSSGKPIELIGIIDQPDGIGESDAASDNGMGHAEHITKPAIAQAKKANSDHDPEYSGKLRRSHL
jgi:hypothetical protein